MTLPRHEMALSSAWLAPRTLSPGGFFARYEAQNWPLFKKSVLHRAYAHKPR